MVVSNMLHRYKLIGRSLGELFLIFFREGLKFCSKTNGHFIPLSFCLPPKKKTGRFSKDYDLTMKLAHM